ncbi:MAG TPA: oxidoreductase, partial [Flavobacteriaceae bacterium]|nr:oxidoreductase [Flavobacteriaceae bacterium]
QQTTHTAARISRLTQVSSPAVKVANAYELDTMVGDGWLAVGDSASAYDPLSSFGI